MCSGKEASSTNNLTLYPHLMKEWDQEESQRRDLHPDRLTRGACNEAAWICVRDPARHRWPAVVFKRTAGQGCPYCSRNRVSSLNSIAPQAPELAEQFDIALNGTTPDTVPVGSNDHTIWWRCPIEPAHHVWQAEPNNRIAGGTGCPDCLTPGTSAQEIRLAYELASALKFAPQRHWLRTAAGRTMQVDMIVPSLELIIEFDGSYWHKDKIDADMRKTARLRSDGWIVIRVREHPLERLDERFDVSVPLLAQPNEAANAVLAHMVDLGLVSAAVAESYTHHGMPVAAAEAESELARRRRAIGGKS
jgi:very-short-patch-repair endonuclease